MSGRREDARFVTGAATYVGDLVRTRPLHAAFARSSVAHGRLGAVDLAAARGLPGVAGVFAAADLDLADIPGRTGRGPEAPAMGRPPLARDRVRYAGEPVAVVVADDRAAAADAVDAVWFDIDPLPAVADVDAALAGDVALFDGTANVVSDTVEGDAALDIAAWPVCATVEVTNQRLAPASIEPLGILAEPRGGRLHVWCSHQAPHRLRRQIAGQLGLDERDVRVVVPDVGGAFGMKGMLFPEYLVVAAAALRLQRAVLWVETRSEHFLGGTHGRGQRHRVTLAGDTDGRIRAADVDIVADVGAYPHNGSAIPWFSRYVATGPYAVPALRTRTRTVVTDRAPTGSYRGAGRPEAAYAIERAVEAFALAAGVDAVEVRRRSFVPRDAFPHTTATGATYDGGDYAAALDLALDLAGADAVRAEQRARRAAGEDPIGLGVGAFVERAGGAPSSSEYARVAVDDDGGVVLRVGTAASGQGHETVWSGLVADVLPVAAAAVRVVAGDTDEVAAGTGTFASRSAQVAGSAIHRTAVQVRDRARSLAADLLEIAADDLVATDGGFAAAGDPAARVALADVARHAAAGGQPLAAEEDWSPGAQTFPYGTYAAVVGVDLATGRVELRRLVAVDDCGRVLHPQIVEGQVHGSTAQGVAQALYEAVEYAPDGQPRTTSFVDYLVPGAPDLPDVVTGRLETPAPSNPLGAKGTGESGCIGAPPAIVNAVLDALRPYGVTDLQMPLTPERVWRALRDARPAHPDGGR